MLLGESNLAKQTKTIFKCTLTASLFMCATCLSAQSPFMVLSTREFDFSKNGGAHYIKWLPHGRQILVGLYDKPSMALIDVEKGIVYPMQVPEKRHFSYEDGVQFTHDGKWAFYIEKDERGNSRDLIALNLSEPIPRLARKHLVKKLVKNGSIPRWSSTSNKLFLVEAVQEQEVSLEQFRKIYPQKKSNKTPRVKSAQKILVIDSATGEVNSSYAIDPKQMSSSEVEQSLLKSRKDLVVISDGIQNEVFQRKDRKRVYYKHGSRNVETSRIAQPAGYSLSRDGKYVLHVSVKEDGHHVSGGELILINRENDQFSVLDEFEKFKPSVAFFSPDGSRIGLISSESGDVTIFEIDWKR